jgi:hypothetical protein
MNNFETTKIVLLGILAVLVMMMGLAGLIYFWYCISKGAIWGMACVLPSILIVPIVTALYIDMKKKK